MEENGLEQAISYFRKYKVYSRLFACMREKYASLYVGMLWTEYFGEMPTGGWLSIRISGVDIDPGTEGDTVLNSVTFG